MKAALAVACLTTDHVLVRTSSENKRRYGLARDAKRVNLKDIAESLPPSLCLLRSSEKQAKQRDSQTDEPTDILRGRQTNIPADFLRARFYFSSPWPVGHWRRACT